MIRLKLPSIISTLKAEKVLIPKFHDYPNIENAAILEWYVKIGSFVTPKEPIVKLDTLKSTIDIHSNTSGIVTEILYEGNKDVDYPLNTHIATIKPKISVVADI